MIDLVTGEAVAALVQVVMIDLVLAGDNAVVIALAAAGLPPEQRRRVIIIGILAATALRIVFAGIAMQLLQILGLLLAGGILLLWVCWKMWRELRTESQDQHATHEMLGDSTPATGAAAATAILLNLAMSALKGTDAFGPGSNRIEQLVCRLRRGIDVGIGP
jgi:YjbE family integral membrane protein